MRYYILIGADSEDGTITYCENDEEALTFTGQNFLGIFDPKIWIIRYDDQNNINEIEYVLNGKQINPEDYGLPSRITDDKLSEYSDWARTKYQSLVAIQEARRITEQYNQDRQTYLPYLSWDEYSEAKKARDRLLQTSDPYILLPNLDGTGWESWRQWVRDLPELYQRPIDIDEWKDLPSNANLIIIDAYDGFKRSIARAKELSEKYTDFVLPVID